VALALYRKYRPRTFAEIIGQEHVTGPLIQALRSGRLNHAYLFSGPRGCGKTSSARILARSLNCERGPTPEPCGECDSCVALAPDGPGSIDVIEIDAASHGGVDDARDLRERAIFAPVSSRFKVYVIDEAHMVSSAGFNALLKLVEEPPDYVKFVFATTEPEKVLGTIKSRTHHYPFRLIAPGVLRPYLEQLCESEGVKVEPAVLPLVVRAGGGSARDSLSVLDQLIAGAGEDGVSYAGAVSLLGVTDVALIDEMCDGLAAGDGAAVYATIDRVADAGHDPRRFASDLLERLRDLIVMQQVPDAAAKGLIDAPADELARMVAQAERFGPATLSRLADIVHTGLTEMRGTTAPRLLLELISARMLLPGADDSTSALLQRLERMERRLTAAGDAPAGWPAPAPPVMSAPVMSAPVVSPAGVAPAVVIPAAQAVPATPTVSAGDAPAPPAPAHAAVAPPPPASQPAASEAPASQAAAAQPAVAQPPVAPPPAPAVTQQQAPVAVPQAGVGQETRSAPGVIDAVAVRRVWDQVLVEVGRKSKKVAAWAREATVRDVDGGTLVLVFKHGFHATALAADPAFVVEAVYEILGGTAHGGSWQLRCEVGGQGAAGAPSMSGPASPGRSAPAAAQPQQAPTAAQAPSHQASSQQAPAAQSAPAPRQSPGRSSGTSAAGRSSGGGPSGGGPSGGGPSGGEPDPEPEPDWPTIARLGGGPDVAPGASGAGPETAASDPAHHQTGGATPSAVADAGGPRSAARAAAGGRSVTAPANRSGAAVADRSTGAAPSRPGGRSGAGGRGANGRVGANGRSADRHAPADAGWDAAPPGEPPYDPDYDPPVRDALMHEGFDPGDEPLDEVIDEQTARQTSEQQALQLLQQTLGAEKIGEVDAR
jgi:DNA polymerase-3 subunit gamma/tau